jgi:putative ABC transport system ATP-binding protein
MSQPIVRIRNLSRVFRTSAAEVKALEDVSLDIEESDFCAFMGPSGSGKTTLLNVICGIEKPTSGSVHVGDVDILKLSEDDLADWRNRNIGFVFQTFNLIPVLTAAENVELPLLLTGLSRSKRREHVRTALELVDLSDRADHYPKQLSGGQQQRVAIARAIVTEPEIILADEPTGNLDAHAAEEALTLLHVLNESLGKTIVMVTHDPRATHYVKTTRHIDKGRLLQPDEAGEQPVSEL